MDLTHNPKDVETFEPLVRYDPYPIIKKKSWDNYEDNYDNHDQEEEYFPDPDPFFEDIPKINIANAIDSRVSPGPGSQSQRLKRFPSPDIEEALGHAPEHR